MPGWLEFVKVFLKVGTLGFGGPFALLAFLEREVVQQKRWLLPEEFAHSTAIGTLTPGPIFFSAAVHVGYRIRRLPGALVAGAAALLPGFLVTILIAALYLQVEDLPVVVRAAQGVTAALVGLLAVMALRTGRTLVKDLTGGLLVLLCFVALRLPRIDPLWVIVIAGLSGAYVFRPKR